MSKRSKITEVPAQVETTKSNKELLQEAIAKLSPEERALIFPPKVMKNFVVRDSWYGRGQILTFTNNKGKIITYNHDDALDIMRPKLSLMPCWIKRGYWSQSTDLPTILRGRVELSVVEAE
jgi:hypothetical protein